MAEPGNRRNRGVPVQVPQRQPLWSRAMAVGDRAWLDTLFPEGRSPKITLTPFDAPLGVADERATHALEAPKRAPQEAWQVWSR